MIIHLIIVNHISFTFLVNVMFIFLSASPRELYYQDVNVFSSQGALDDIVDDISCMLQVPRWNLNIVSDCVISTELFVPLLHCVFTFSSMAWPTCPKLVLWPQLFHLYLQMATSKGLVAGNLAFSTADGEYIDCSASTSVGYHKYSRILWSGGYLCPRLLTAAWLVCR